MINAMNDNRTGIFGTIVTWSLTGLSAIVNNFEAHATTYAAAAAVMVSIATLINIVRGWIKNKKD